MVEYKNDLNILHYGSNKCERIAKSVMVAETQALVLGFNYVSLLKDMVEKMLGRRLRLEELIDSDKVFSVISKEGKTAEKNMRIYVLP